MGMAFLVDSILQVSFYLQKSMFCELYTTLPSYQCMLSDYTPKVGPLSTVSRAILNHMCVSYFT